MHWCYTTKLSAHWQCSVCTGYVFCETLVFFLFFLQECRFVCFPGASNMTTVLAHWELLICSRWVCININPLYSSHVSVENSIITICAVCAKGLCNQSCLCFVFIYNYVTAVCHFASQKCPEKRSSCFPFTFKLTVDCQFTPCWVLLPFLFSCLCAPCGSGSSVRHVARLGYSLLLMHIDMCSGSASIGYSS